MPPKGAWPLLLEDYPEAVVRIANLRAEGVQHLVFAWIELFPFDTTPPAGWFAGTKPWSVPRTANWSCGFSATKVSTADAVRWYLEASAGLVNIAPAVSKRVLVQPIQFGAEPAFGRFALGVEAPFLLPWHDGPRVHRLVPLQGPPRAVRVLSRCPEAREWMGEHLGFDPFAFDEWLGSVAMIAPDPLCCAIETYPGQREADGGETLRIRVTPRRNAGRTADLSTATLLVGERRSGAWTSVMPLPLEPTRRTIAFPQMLGEMGHALVCTQRGLLRLVEPHQWLRQVNLHLLMGVGRATIEVPSGGRRKQAHDYEVSLRTNATKSVVGEAVHEGAAARLDRLMGRRKSREKRGRAPQYVFGRDSGGVTSGADSKAARDLAHEFVLDLIRRASRRLIFVDPYFGRRELRDLALRNENPAVKPYILTGHPGLRANVGDAPGFQVQAGLALVSDLVVLKEQYGSRTPVVRVMPGGNTPDIHDRFLIVDDEVWHCGPSFNEIGERTGVIVRLPNALEIRRAVSRVWARSQSIEDLAPQICSEQGPV